MLIDKNTFKLLRFPFSFFLMPLFLLALSQSVAPTFAKTLLCFLIIHLLIYPASNGYNSYVDRDIESIGGIEKPPLPTRHLFYVTVFLDVVAIILAFLFVNHLFALCLFLYVCASKAYSSRLVRLKQYPVTGFLIVVFFQGAFTYFMVMAGIANGQLYATKSTWFILLACSFQIAGAYPLTQIYQYKQDLKDNVITISYRMGYKGTFLFTALMFLFCAVFYYLYFMSIDLLFNFYLLQLFFIPIIIFFAYWFYKVNRSETEASFKNAMRMNWIAASCMNLCFIVLYFLNHYN